MSFCCRLCESPVELVIFKIVLNDLSAGYVTHLCMIFSRYELCQKKTIMWLCITRKPRSALASAMFVLFVLLL